MAKVLIISSAFPPMKAGESDHCYRIGEQFLKRGLEVHILTRQGNGIKDGPPFRVHPIMPSWEWRDTLRLAREVRRLRPDAVLVLYIGWIYDEHPMMTFIPTLCKWAIPGVRVVTLFEYFSSWRPERWGRITRLVRRAAELLCGRERVDYSYGTLLRDSDAIVTLSGKHTNALVSHDAAVTGKVSLVPPPPLLHMAEGPPDSIRAAARKEIGVQPDEFLIAYFGYIYPPKGVDTLMHALALVHKENPRSKLILIGGVIAQKYPDWPTYAEDMKRLPGQLGIERSVIWFGDYEAESDAPSRYLSASDACAFAHHHGIYLNNSSFAAAAAHGLPIIATRPQWVEAPFVDGHNILFCEPNNPEALADGLIRMARDPALCARLGQGARELAHQWYSWEVATLRLCQALGLSSAQADRTRENGHSHRPMASE